MGEGRDCYRVSSDKEGGKKRKKEKKAGDGSRRIVFFAHDRKTQTSVTP